MTSVHTFFGTTVPEALRKNAAKAGNIKALLHVRATGEGGGDWTIDVTVRPPTCKPGNPPRPDLFLHATVADLEAVINKPELMMPYYLSGKLKVTGNALLLATLRNLF